MIKSYKKILEMESIAELKIEQDKKALEKIKKILYQKKGFILNKLIAYLKKELGISYFRYKFIDINGNVVESLIKKESKIFKENIETREIINFSAEEIIDKRIFDNQNEILIIDLSYDDEWINLGYLCDSLNYEFLSYSDEIKDRLEIFVDYVISRKMYNSKTF